jgi:transcriptional regulator with XRE-family HTH domain
MDFPLLGKRIRDERLLLRLTLAQLAERTDKSINFIGQIERGEGKPSVETLVDIANALGTTIDILLRDNLKANNDNISREINALLLSIDNIGKEFVLEMVRKYVYYHNPPQ